MSVWHDTPPKKTPADGSVMANRPSATSILFDNITMTAAWIEGGYSDPDLSFKQYGRVVNNVTLAMPHPGMFCPCSPSHASGNVRKLTLLRGVSCSDGSHQQYFATK